MGMLRYLREETTTKKRRSDDKRLIANKIVNDVKTLQQLSEINCKVI